MNGKNIIVLYDSWCPLCKKSKFYLEKIDWLNKLVFQSIRDSANLQKYQIDMEVAEQRMHTFDSGKNRLEEGMYSIVRISKAIPLLWLFLPLFQLSLLCGVGQKLYDFIAKRRRILPVGHCIDHPCEIAKKD